MKAVKIIGLLLLVFAVYTVIGMILNNNSFWMVYNIVTLILSVVSGIILLKQK